MELVSLDLRVVKEGSIEDGGESAFTVRWRPGMTESCLSKLCQPRDRRTIAPAQLFLINRAFESERYDCKTATF
ncbi:hypothetical protein V1477_008123 [Vespula maculifrons]|uniref:Uncharacterized protein n=1 Tax=Vespula maculifrons TaxID=7453 RepID=A0ABD2CF39_VESMC